jgi:hypothetical protein
MTPIEIILGRYGYKVLTGTADTDLSSLNIVAIVARSAGATFAKLEIDDVSVLADRGLTSVALDNTDLPIIAGYDKGSRTTKKFSAVQLTNAADSVCLIYGE